MLLRAQKSAKVDLLLERECRDFPIDFRTRENRGFESQDFFLALIDGLQDDRRLGKVDHLTNPIGNETTHALNSVLLRPERRKMCRAHLVIERDGIGQITRSFVGEAPQEWDKRRWWSVRRQFRTQRPPPGHQT